MFLYSLDTFHQKGGKDKKKKERKSLVIIYGSFTYCKSSCFLLLSSLKRKNPCENAVLCWLKMKMIFREARWKRSHR
jgi:hypothetical protein